MPVRKFTWQDLPDLLDFAGNVQAQNDQDRGARQQNFKEVLGQPDLYPQENCLLLEENGQILGSCIVFPEPPIRRAVLGLDLASNMDGTPQELELVQQGLKRSREQQATTVHICLGVDSPRAEVLRQEGFHLARVYWDMLWYQDELAAITVPQGFTIRSFQPGDAAALTQVQNAAFTGSWGFSPNTVEQTRYRSSMSNTAPQGIVFLEEGERLAGYCWTCLAPAGGKYRGIIGMMGIAPEYRGRGISKPILLAGMEYLRSVPVHDIGLHVDGDNTPATRLYTSVGFEKVGELHWYEYKNSC